MAVWSVGWDEIASHPTSRPDGQPQSHPNQQTRQLPAVSSQPTDQTATRSLIQTSRPDSHPQSHPNQQTRQPPAVYSFRMKKF